MGQLEEVASKFEEVSSRLSALAEGSKKTMRSLRSPELDGLLLDLFLVSDDQKKAIAEYACFSSIIRSSLRKLACMPSGTPIQTEEKRELLAATFAICEASNKAHEGISNVALQDAWIKQSIHKIQTVIDKKAEEAVQRALCKMFNEKRSD
jgi:hypothetical protein